MTKTTIGRIVHPDWHYDLESSLRLHTTLIKRALQPEWRFKGQWVTTGPLETLLGYPGCGDSGCSPLELRLPAVKGLGDLVRSVNANIFRALCEFPKFAELSEEFPETPLENCAATLIDLENINGRKTKESMNDCHKRARTVRSIRLACSRDGVFLDAEVACSMRDSSWWGLFWLARKSRPRWNGRGRLAKWLGRCVEILGEYVEDSK